MIGSNSFSEQKWFSYLEPRLQKQVGVAQQLIESFSHHADQPELADYSFLVFPMAKAFEGFIKQFFLDLELVDQRTFESRRFRVGRALNPDVKQNQRNEYWLFDDVKKVCGEELARDLWETWLVCRNRVFHFFPKHDQSLTFAQASEKIHQLSQVMTRALTCKLIQSKFNF